MAKVEHYYTKFEKGNYYHIYNRSVDKKPMFKNDGNYLFFLKKYLEYLSPVLETHAYCLLGNHFHLMVRIKETFDLPPSTAVKPQTIHDRVSHQFRKFFQSYAMAFNKQHNRIGTLFQTPFKRALIDSDAYFTEMVYYVHGNPQKHGLIHDFRQWKWSSYRSFLSDKPSALQREAVLNWFGGVENFVTCHAMYQQRLISKNMEQYDLDEEGDV